MAITTSWSLTVEECFYVLAPLIFILCKKYNFWLPLLLTIFLLVLILFTYGNNLTAIFLVFSGSFFGCFLKFFAGIYLALIILKTEKKGFVDKKGQKWTIAGIAGTLLLLIPLVYVTNKSHSVQYPVLILINNFLMPFTIAMFYYGLICESSSLRRMLSGRLMGLLGRSSYAFYLLHVPLIIYLGTTFIKPYFSDNYYNLYVLTIFAITMALSIAVYVFYENPLNIFIRKKAGNFFTSSKKSPQ